MIDKVNSTELLETISSMLGMEVAFFLDPGARPNPSHGLETSYPCSPPLLNRLVTAFRALPSRQSRERALLMLEALAVEAGGVGNDKIQ